MRQAVIVSAVRTPVGSFQGSLSSLSATQLGSVVITEALRRVDLPGGEVDEVIMGNVLSAGLGQGPARQARLGAGLPHNVAFSTINKNFGSRVKAVMLTAHTGNLGEA